MENGEPEEESEPTEDGAAKIESSMSSESIDMSYRHLAEPARKLFARMSFFPGGLSGQLDLFELLGDDWKDAAENLTNYALARYDRSMDRYTMSKPVREYAQKRLDEMEGDEFRCRAAESWADFARWHDLMIDVRPSAQEAHETRHSEGFAALMAEEVNLVHAAEWALGAGEETGLGIVNSLDDYLNLKARWCTKDRLYRLALPLRRQLAADNPEEYLPDVAMTLNNMGNLHQMMGHPDEALKHYEEALGIYRDFYGRYPSAHARNFLIVLRGTAKVYEKLGMAEKADECKKEIEKVKNYLSSQN